MLLMKVISDTNSTTLHHLLRVLYSSSESINCLIADVTLMKDVSIEIKRAVRHPVKQITQINLSSIFERSRKQIEEILSDSHLSAFEAFSTRIFNSLEEINELLKSTLVQPVESDVMINVSDKLIKRFRELEMTLLTI